MRYQLFPGVVRKHFGAKSYQHCTMVGGYDLSLSGRGGPRSTSPPSPPSS